MVLNNIEQLLAKYENGETSLKEEQQLKEYFSQETVEPHLEMYKPMFQFFLVTKQERFTKDVPLIPIIIGTKKTNVLYKWIAVAAIAVLMFGIYNKLNKPITSLDQLSNEERLVYNQTVEGFKYLGLTISKGSEKMQTLSLLSDNLNKGSQSIEYIDEFSKATSKILK